MRSEHGQATVEHAGLLLAAAALLGALAISLGGPGPAAAVASAIARAFDAALGRPHGAPIPAQLVDATPLEYALLAAAFAAGTADARPPLGDLRRELVERLGDVAGGALYEQLVLGAADPLLADARRAHAYLAALDGGFDPPETGRLAIIETPQGSPHAHVVTIADADHAVARLAHPGTDAAGIVTDLLGLVPGEGTVASAARLVSDAASIESVATQLSDDARDVPPGARADDVVVSWPVTRSNPAVWHGSRIGARARSPDAPLMRVEVIRDGRVIARYLTTRPPVTDAATTTTKGNVQ